MQTTPVSLLERLRQPDEQAAWERFVELYTPLLYHWGCRLGASEHDAADLVQDLFIVLVREMRHFQYQAGRRFRGWLWTITVNKWRERCRRCAAQPVQVAGLNLDPADPSDAIAAFDEAEYRSYLVNRSLQLMQAEFQPTTWKACWECVVAGRPAAEVATELGLSASAVRQAKSRVLRRLRQELQGLLD
jgi:RNA polymerase sigma-70 factor, ECF subfamily